MAYNTHLLRNKKIINEWHLELLAYVDDANEQAGVPTTRPLFSSYPGTFTTKKTKMRTITSSTMFGNKLILNAKSKYKRQHFESKSCEGTP